MQQLDNLIVIITTELKLIGEFRLHLLYEINVHIIKKKQYT